MCEAADNRVCPAPFFVMLELMWSKPVAVAMNLRDRTFEKNIQLPIIPRIGKPASLKSSYLPAQMPSATKSLKFLTFCDVTQICFNTSPDPFPPNILLQTSETDHWVISVSGLFPGAILEPTIWTPGLLNPPYSPRSPPWEFSLVASQMGQSTSGLFALL